jgi:hypothetical protein
MHSSIDLYVTASVSSENRSLMFSFQSVTKHDPDPLISDIFIFEVKREEESA